MTISYENQNLNTTSTYDISEDFLNLYTIQQILHPTTLKEGQTSRIRCRNSEMKILYQMFQFEKNIRCGKWTDIYPSMSTIASAAQVSTSSIKTFSSTEIYKLLIDKINRQTARSPTQGFQSNRYILRPGVAHIFDLLEKNGFMKGFRSDFKKWKKTFLSRICPILKKMEETGCELPCALMNKYEQKKSLKPTTQKPLKPTTINPSGDEALRGYRSKYDSGSILPCHKNFEGICMKLGTEFLIPTPEINKFMSRYSLSHLASASRLNEDWIKNGMDINHPERAYQKCLNLTKPKSRSLPV